MKILDMELNNFRQYLGEQRIEFAADKQNITIVYGENGKGKTGIFRALMFALFGHTHIQQDNPKEPIHLVNLKKLEEMPGVPVEASVKVRFLNHDKTYEIKRSVIGMKSGVQISQRDGDISFVEIDSQGNYSPNPKTNQHEVNQIINSILDEDVKDFFLFDGEKIDTLAKTNETVKKEVKKAIFKLLQIDNVEEARALLNNLKINERRKVINETSDTNVKQKNDEIEQLHADLKKQKVYLEKHELNLIENNKLIGELEFQLAQNEDIARVQERLASAVRTSNSIKDHINNISENILDFVFSKAPYLLMNNAFYNVKNYLETTIAENNTNVPVEVLRESASTGVCLCCNNDLKLHKENMAYIETLIKNYVRSESNTFSNNILGMISSCFEDANKNEEEALKLLKLYRDKENELREIENDIYELKKELGEKASKELNLEKTAKALDAQKLESDSIKESIGKTKGEIELLEKNILKAEDELSKLMRTISNNRIEERVIKMIESLTEDIEAIATDFSSAMRDQLRDATTEIFKILIDRKDINLIKEININSKYEIEIINFDGVEITQDISQGQRQIVALSFITALARVAAGDGKIIDFPLFMDSPFNRLSGMNRDHLIENIPNLTSQWILLLTDTELTKSEERVFKNGNHLGKWYRINQIETYHSVIEPVLLTETMSTRGE
ncbi:AAA family ATPase [Lysinibacillus halotolerans]|uniref:Nuclease SbcCD subunit C n=1 Tax=Lysinibacillus halotolerans TaxID=1368476 RepID=A0A3M8HAX4_9BACI|nr:AAA family ATPase [Lysinibacillus halotolerans]RNC99552.1 hypothetical protein EC501_07330 [Lysinibacillus halotolerans]